MNQAESILYDAAASRAIDARAIAEIPVAGFELMRRAARAAFDELLCSFPGADSVTVYCGKGNNAGDAYLVAGLAHRYGMTVQLIAVEDPAGLSGDAALAYRESVAAGLTIVPAVEAPCGAVIVDGLLGTGIRGAPRAPYDRAIRVINGSRRPVLAIDVPSGVDVDTGAVHADAVRADITVSFITRKIGLYTGAGVAYAGRRVFAGLGVPDYLYTDHGLPLLRWRPEILPSLSADTYKHRQGHVVVAGGDINMPGAVSMAAQAALRVGAGMVTVITRESHSPGLIARTPEVMVVDGGSELAAQVLQRADLAVLGPGLGRTDWGQRLYALVEQAGLPTVLDADGLYWLAQAGAWRGGSLWITPHAAEAARLLDVSVREVQHERLQSSKQLADRYGCAGVLKGAGSVVFAEDIAGICAHGNPGMATAGMGDVLSGVLGGLLAEVCAGGDESLLRERLIAAVALHSAAADAAAAEVGLRSLMASDVIRALPATMSGSSSP